jgi:hypothetical protein
MAFSRISSFNSQDSGYGSDIVEVFDEPLLTAAKQQEHSKDVSRQRQLMIADQLSQQDAKEYQQDILEHMLRMDADTIPDVDSIDIQTEIQWFMRPYLLDFLVEAHSAFQLLPETLFLTINLLDRYCSKRVVYKRHYQLVGCAALLIASKYGDKKEKVPTIKELKSMCCSLYDDDMFLQMEWHVLSTLSWAVGHPTVDNFVKMTTKDKVYDPEVENLTLYLLEISLYHRDFVSKQSSTMALAALALARHILGRPQARANEYASRYCNTTLLALSQKLHEPSLILSRKYASARYSCASRTLSSFLAHQAALAAAAQAPPTPTYELTPPQLVSKPAGVDYFAAYSTPQKPQAPSFHGYPTPPITPEEEVFSTTNNHNYPRFGSSTPTPNATDQAFTSFNFGSQYQQPAQFTFVGF